MSLIAIIVIAVVAVIGVCVLLAFLPRLRERGRVKARERELGQRRERAAQGHRQEAEARLTRAEEAEQRARIAEQEARRERAEAQVSREKAGLHDQGLADHELIDEEERERFAGTSAVDGSPETSSDGVEQRKDQPAGRR